MNNPVHNTEKKQMILLMKKNVHFEAEIEDQHQLEFFLTGLFIITRTAEKLSF